MTQYAIRSGNAPAEILVNGGVVANLGPSTVYYADSQDVTPTFFEGYLDAGVTAVLEGSQFFTTNGPRASLNVVAPPFVSGGGGGTGPQGPPGATGPSGPPGADGTGFAYRGLYNNSATYNTLDVVWVTGAPTTMYIATQNGLTGVTPPGTGWDLFPITGATGAEGPTGPAGPTGPIGPQGGSGSTSLAGLTDVTGTATDRQVIRYRSSTGKFVFKDPNVFDVRDYGAVLDGITDDAAAIDAAYTAAAVKGGIVDLGYGTLFCNSGSGSNVVHWSAFQGGPVTIRGAGRTASKIKFGAARTFVGQGNGYGAGIVYKDLELRDFTIDCNNVGAGSSSNYGVVLGLGGRCSVDNLHIRRVDTINVGTLNTSIERRNVDLTIFCTNYTDAAGPFHVKNVKLEDCFFGRSGGGGNYGALIQGFASTLIWFLFQATAPDPGGISGCEMDDIHITRCRYDSGGSVPGGTQAFSSTGFMVGGNALGKRLRITDCYVRNSCDDGFEIGSWYDAVVTGCVVENCPQEGFFCANLGGMPQPERQVIKFVNCGVIRNDALGASTSIYGFGARHKRGVPHGTLIFENCYQQADRSTATKYSPQTFNILTDFHQLIIRNFKHSGYIYQDFTANSQLKQFYPIRIGNQSGRGIVRIDGFDMDLTYILDRKGFSGPNFRSVTIQIEVAADMMLQLRNISANLQMVLKNNGVLEGPQPSWTAVINRGFDFVGLSQGGDSNYLTFPFENAAAGLSLLQYDAGSTGDFVATATGVQTTGTPTAEKIIRELAAAGTFESAGPITDGQTWTGGITGSTTTDFKLAAIPKALCTDYDSRFLPPVRKIEGYVTDDGTNSYLCLDKVIDGTRTSLLGTIVGGAGTVTSITTPTSYQSDRGIQLASRISTATSVWVRCGIQDNVVVAEYLSTEPGYGTTTGGTVVQTTGSITLSASDAALLGDGVQGYPSVGWVPIDSSFRLKRYTSNRRHVIRGFIDGFIFPRRLQENDWGFYAYYTGLGDDRLRFKGLQLRHDFSRCDPAIMGEYQGLTAVMKRGIKLMPGSISKTSRQVSRLSHIDMAEGVVVGGNSGTAFTVDAGNSAYWFEQRTLNNNCTITLSNVAPGGRVELELTQDGTGSRTVTLAAPGGTVTATTVASAASSRTLVSLYTPDGVNFRTVTTQNV
jgi:hypothetical protein